MSCGFESLSDARTMLNFFPFARLCVVLCITLVWADISDLDARCFNEVNHVQTTIFLIQYQLVMETEIFSNTSFVINEGITIDVTNAPTNLLIQTIDTSTQTMTHTV